METYTVATEFIQAYQTETVLKVGFDIFFFFMHMQVQRPQIEPIIYRDLFLFRTLASFLNGFSLQKLGCNAELIVDEFGEKLLEELDYTLVSHILLNFTLCVLLC